MREDSIQKRTNQHTLIVTGCTEGSLGQFLACMRFVTVAMHQANIFQFALDNAIVPASDREVELQTTRATVVKRFYPRTLKPAREATDAQTTAGIRFRAVSRSHTLPERHCRQTDIRKDSGPPNCWHAAKAIVTTGNRNLSTLRMQFIKLVNERKADITASRKRMRDQNLN